MTDTPTEAVEVAAPIEADAAAEVAAEPAKEAVPAKDAAAAKAVAAAKKLVSIEAKVKGQSKKIDLDLDNMDELKKHVERSLAMEDTFQSAAQQRKQIESFINQLKKDPAAILRHPDIGVDIKKFAEQIILQEMEEHSKTPEQREQEKFKKELEELRAAKKQAEEEKRNMELEAIKQKNIQEMDEQITEALKTSNVPKSPYVVKRIADALIEASSLTNEDGSPMFPDITVKQIMPYVEQQIQEEIQNMFGVMPTEVLEKLVGKQHLSKMKAARVAKAKEVVSSKQIKDTGSKKEDTPKEDKKITTSQFFGRF